MVVSLALQMPYTVLYDALRKMLATAQTVTQKGSQDTPSINYGFTGEKG